MPGPSKFAMVQAGARPPAEAQAMRRACRGAGRPGGYNARTPRVERHAPMSSEELRNYATVVAAIVALLVFIVNVWSQTRSRRIENLARFNQVHQRLFADNGYLASNLKAIEDGTMERDRANPQMEARFHLMLLEIERLAILANNKAVPRSTQIYMLGSYAPTILKLMTDEERASMYWELAREYLDGIAIDSERYAKLTRKERAQFWR